MMLLFIPYFGVYSTLTKSSMVCNDKKEYWTLMVNCNNDIYVISVKYNKLLNVRGHCLLLFKLYVPHKNFYVKTFAIILNLVKKFKRKCIQCKR